MEYVKTNGIGFEFTDNEANALLFDSEPKATRWANRLKKQYLKQHIWEVVARANGYCIRVTSRKANRAKRTER